MIKIDGSFGEGGGQILRSSLTLSMLTNQPFQIKNIRANRKKPGLLRQHLTAVKAAATISGAKVEGDFLTSTTLTFSPKEIESGEFTFKVGSAGSCMLVLQTILPALMFQDQSSKVYLEGGTHNPMAPPFDFLKKSFLPILEKMGISVHMEIQRTGFYPAGGGQVCVSIAPFKKLSQVSILNFGQVLQIKPKVFHANLPFHIVQRELSTIRKKLSLDFDDRDSIQECKSIGPGNVVEIEVTTDQISQSFYGFSFHGTKAEHVAQDCIDQVKYYLEEKVPIGEHLCDQLIIPMVYAKGSFVSSKLSKHTKTNIEVVQHFMDVNIELEELDNDQVLLTFQ
ncbi:RNA 3'-terminal phosphate cyclase [bacterium]|nr:RNA 3'-terminal phosphate cyclase [bacterium]